MIVMDIPYALTDPYQVPFTRFISIWKVVVDDRYNAVWSNGMTQPGLFLTYEGNGRLELNGGNCVRLETGSYVFVDREIPCRYYCPTGGEWKFYFFHLSDLDMVRDLHMPVSSVCATAAMKEICALCERLIGNLIQDGPGCKYVANHTMHELLLMLARESVMPEAEINRPISQTIHWMHRNLEKPLLLEAHITASGLNRSSFFALFKKETGVTPAAYFTKLKMKSALLTLQTSTLSVKEIAESLGFCDEFHFSKTFKKEFAVSPSVCRRR